MPQSCEKQSSCGAAGSAQQGLPVPKHARLSSAGGEQLSDLCRASPSRMAIASQKTDVPVLNLGEVRKQPIVDLERGGPRRRDREEFGVPRFDPSAGTNVHDEPRSVRPADEEVGEVRPAQGAPAKLERLCGNVDHVGIAIENRQRRLLIQRHEPVVTSRRRRPVHAGVALPPRISLGDPDRSDARNIELTYLIGPDVAHPAAVLHLDSRSCEFRGGVLGWREGCQDHRARSLVVEDREPDNAYFGYVLGAKLRRRAPDTLCDAPSD